MKTLYIYNSIHDKKHAVAGDVYSYLLNGGELYGVAGISNNPKRLHEIALEIRDEYSTYIYSLHQRFIDAGVIGKDHVSYFFFTDLSNKRTEFFETFHMLCHVLCIKEEIEKRGIDAMVIEGCTNAFVEAIRSLLSFMPIEVRSTGKKKNITLFHSISSAVSFGVSLIIKRVLVAMSGISSSVKNAHSLFLTFYPLHLKEEGEEIKYGNLARSEGSAYVVTIQSDGMLQKQNWRTYWKNLCSLKRMSSHVPLVLLSSAIHAVDIVNYFRNAFWLLWKRHILMNQAYVFNGIAITQYLREELHLSFMRLPRLLLYENAFKRVYSQAHVKKAYYYMHEYCWGRFMTYVLTRMIPSITCIGFQHGPASRRKLLYSLARGEVMSDLKDYVHHMAIPHMVLAEDSSSKSIYEESGYENVYVMIEVHRLSYLKRIVRKPTERYSVLIACGLHDADSIFEALKKEIQECPERNYIFKFHPKSIPPLTVEKIKRLSCNNLEIGSKSIVQYLACVHEVVSTYSSVGYEAHVLGIHSRILVLRQRINESPLLDMIGKKNITIQYC